MTSTCTGKELETEHVNGAPLIAGKLSSLQEKWDDIEQNWDDRAKLLNQCRFHIPLFLIKLLGGAYCYGTDDE